MMSDPIADMLTRIRNANTAKHDTVDVPASKMKVALSTNAESFCGISSAEARMISSICSRNPNAISHLYFSFEPGSGAFKASNCSI